MKTKVLMSNFFIPKLLLTKLSKILFIALFLPLIAVVSPVLAQDGETAESESQQQQNEANENQQQQKEQEQATKESNNKEQDAASPRSGEFVPSEEISEDVPVSFPVDI